MTEPGTASPLKLRVARIVTSDPAGRLIGTLSAHRVRHHGLVFDVRSSDFSPRVRAQMFWGIYESAETRMIRDQLRGSTMVVELGSSLGVTSAHIAALMAPGGHLVCVEANPRLLPGLRDRLAGRAGSLRVDVVHAAVAGHCGDAALAVSATTVGSRVGAARPRETTVTVPALTLREILRRTGVDDFDLVSDIEGTESTFFLRDPGVLDRCQRAVIELHDSTDGGRRVPVSALLEAAVAAGFRVVRRHGPVVALARSLRGGPRPRGQAQPGRLPDRAGERGWPEPVRPDGAGLLDPAEQRPVAQ
jgi:FkbM family methyltransferase